MNVWDFNNFFELLFQGLTAEYQLWAHMQNQQMQCFTVFICTQLGDNTEENYGKSNPGPKETFHWERKQISVDVWSKIVHRDWWSGIGWVLDRTDVWKPYWPSMTLKKQELGAQASVISSSDEVIEHQGEVLGSRELEKLDFWWANIHLWLI